MKKTTATIAALGLAATLVACGTAEPSPVTTTAAPSTIDWSKSTSGGPDQVKAEADRIAAEEKAANDKQLAEAEADAAAAKKKLEAAIPEEGEAALQSAQQYLDFSGFSEKGLRDQLKFEKFPAKAVDYAMKNVNADYNAEAVETAKTYLEMGGMSKAGLRDQLAFEGYSKAQINHAMKNV